jgi:hypothetical protein
VTNVLPVDVNVTFKLCMSGEPTSGAPCVIGSAPEIGSWGSGVMMTSLGGDLYEVVVTFLAGHNPYFEYKFKKDGCSNWEGASNRIVTLPTDGTTSVVLGIDSWNNLPIGCGVGEVLVGERTVCLQVCLDGVDNTGGVCAIGSVPQLSNWGAGVPAVQVGPGLYQTCIVFPAGMAIPLVVEYKFKKDDCGTWESVGNRSFVVDNAMPSEQTLTSNWGRQHLGRLLPRRQRECGLGFGEVAVPVVGTIQRRACKRRRPGPGRGRRFAGQAWRPRRARISLEISSIGLPVTSTTAQPGLPA